MNIDKTELLKQFITARIDMKNYGNEKNSIEILHNTDNDSKITRDSWFKDEEGEGLIIQSTKSEIDLKIKCINDGLLKIYLRSKDVKDKNNVRFPILIDYTSFKVNDIPLLDNHNAITHDSPYIFKKEVKNSEIVSISCKWLPFNSFCELDKKNNPNELDLKKELDRFEEYTNDCLDSYNFLFNKLFIDFKQEPINLMKDLKVLCVELLSFVSNICQKYHLEWWLDYGNLIGAVRHENFIPWDDDVDIGMMRKEYNKLNAIIKKEIKAKNLDKIITVTHRKREIDGKIIGSFLQVLIFHNYNNEKILLAGVDVFPYDYLNKFENIDKLNELHYTTRLSFYRNLSNNLSYDESLKQYYEELDCNLEKTSLIIPGVEGAAGPKNLYPLFVIDTDKIFPLTNCKFSDKQFPCPNNSQDYLKAIYGDYMNIPKIIRHHGRVENLRYSNNAREFLRNYITILKNVNDTFEYE